jgi:hypothetical protein
MPFSDRHYRNYICIYVPNHVLGDQISHGLLATHQRVATHSLSRAGLHYPLQSKTAVS